MPKYLFISFFFLMSPLKIISQDFPFLKKTESMYLGRVNLDYTRHSFLLKTGRSFGADVILLNHRNLKLGLRHEFGSGTQRFIRPFSCCDPPPQDYKTKTWGVNLIAGAEIKEKLPFAVYGELILGTYGRKYSGNKKDVSGLLVYMGLRVYISRILFKAGISFRDGISTGLGINI